MLGSFRVRMLIVIIIITLAALSMQYEHSSKKIVEPAIGFVLKDYGVQKKITLYIAELRKSQDTPVPVSNSTTLQLPCDFAEIEKNYGWHWNAESSQQEFFPAILLKVEENSEVTPVFKGEIADISVDEGGRYTILVDHGANLYSSYGGLCEVIVQVGERADKETIIGKSGSNLYFQMTGSEGPIDPGIIFE